MRIPEFKYRLFDIAPILPAVYDEQLSFYEIIVKMAKRIDFLTDSVNENFTKMTSDFMHKYITKYVAANFSYTEEDQGLHLDVSGVQIDGDHKYDPKTKTMEIVSEEDLKGGDNDE